MLKTIKRTKELTVPEFLQWLKDNHEKLKQELMDKNYILFRTEKEETELRFDIYGNVDFDSDWDNFNIDDTVLIEEEEPITEDMKFDELVERYINVPLNSGAKTITHENFSIGGVLQENKNTSFEALQIYGLINGKLELIWENKHYVKNN